MTADDQRKLVAIVSVDVAGYSRLVGRDESGTLSRLGSLFDGAIYPRVAARDGRVVKSMGDGLLIEFTSALNAVACALEFQKFIAEKEADVAEGSRISFRVGVNIGDIVVAGDDILGDGVNLAARLQEIADPAASASPASFMSRSSERLIRPSRTWGIGNSRTSSGRCVSIASGFHSCPAMMRQGQDGPS